MAALLICSLLMLLASCLRQCQASPDPQPATTRATASVRTIYEFPNETWVENLAVRSNGNILVTLLTAPELWEINVTAQTAELLYTFPAATSALGIAELEHDVFAVAVGNLTVTNFKGTPGSWSVWRIDLNCLGTLQSVQKAVSIKTAVFLNGMTALPTAAGSVLVGDSALGVIFRADLATGAYKTVIDDAALKPNKSVPFVLGVNGIHVRGDFLYFTNSFKPPLLGRIPINKNGTDAGPAQTIVARPTFPTNDGGFADDFTFDMHGNAFVTTDLSNTLIEITPNGKATVIAGGNNNNVLAGDTSAAFGRTWESRNTLYITTNGGLANPPPGGIVGGKLAAIDIAHLSR